MDELCSIVLDAAELPGNYVAGFTMNCAAMKHLKCKIAHLARSKVRRTMFRLAQFRLAQRTATLACALCLVVFCAQAQQNLPDGPKPKEQSPQNIPDAPQPKNSTQFPDNAPPAPKNARPEASATPTPTTTTTQPDQQGPTGIPNK